MSLSLRRFLYLFAILVFLIAAPLLVMYTAGFRFDVYKKTIRPTGSLFIKTLPGKADVYVNNEQASSKTPIRINHLLPNTYAISIQKQGFDTWSKQLTINSRTTTFAENIVLWYTDPSLTRLLEANTITKTCISPRERFVLYEVDTTLYLLHVASNKQTQIKELSSTLTDCTWSTTGEYALLETANGQTVLYTAADETSIILAHTDGPIRHTRFHPTLPSTITYATDQGIYQTNIITDQTQTLLSKPVIDYALNAEDVYYITGPEPTLLTRATSVQDEQVPIIQLPDLLTVSFNKIIDNRAFVHDTETQTLYSISLEPDTINKQSHIFHNVQQWKINTEHDKILIYNDWEISVIHIPSYTIETITRVSTPIQNVLWYADSNYILVQFNDHIEAIELDKRDTRNTSELTRADHISDVTLGYTGEYVYFLNKNATSTTYQKMHITEVDKPFFGF